MIQRLISSIALALSIMFLCCSELDKPNRVESGVSTWFTTFGGPKKDVPKLVTPSPDGGYTIIVIAGDPMESPRLQVVRLDENGTVSRLIEFPTGYYVTSGISMSDAGEYFMTNRVYTIDNPACHDTKVTKISSTGELLWEGVIDHSCWEELGPVLARPDGGCIITGSYAITDSLGSYIGRGMFLSILDDAGHTVLDTTYLEATYLNLVDIVSIGRDRFVVVGNYRKEKQGGIDIVLLAFDCFGELLWMKTFGEEGSETVERLSVTEGGLLVSGRPSYSDWSYFKIDFDGNLLWQRRAQYVPSTDTRSYSIRTSVVTRDECLIAAGCVSIREERNDTDFYFCKWDRSGKLAWAREKGGWKWDELRFVLEASDGGYLFVGLTESVGEGRTDIFVLKTDRDGKY